MMEINKLIRKRLLVFATTLLIIVVLTISSSYALANNDITKTDIQENTNKLFYYVLEVIRHQELYYKYHYVQ